MPKLLRLSLFLSFLGLWGQGIGFVFVLVYYTLQQRVKPKCSLPLFLSSCFTILIFSSFLVYHDVSLLFSLKQFARYILPVLSASLIFISVRTSDPDSSLRYFFVSARNALPLLLIDVSQSLLITKNFSLLTLSGGAWSSKKNTVFFVDSNFHGLCAAFVFSLTLCIVLQRGLRAPFSFSSLLNSFRRATSYFVFDRDYPFVLFLSFLVVMLSQSLSAWICVLLSISLSFLLRCLRKMHILRFLSSLFFRIFLFPCLVLGIFVVALNLSSFSSFLDLSSYGSLDSKILIISHAFTHLSSSLANLFLGVGPQAFSQESNTFYQAHNFLGILSESGLWLFIYVVPFFYLLYKDSVYIPFALPLVLVFFIGLFPLSAYSVYFYGVLAVLETSSQPIYLFSQRHRNR